MVKNLLARALNWVAETLPGETSVDQLPAYSASAFPAQTGYYDGEKFVGGFGPTSIFIADYWELRAKSAQLFQENIYARGLIRRLVTNEINTGLNLEAIPEEAILGYEEDALNDWTEIVENRFTLWGKNPALCDYRERQSFGALQAAARLEALVAGDVLVVLRQHPKTKLPTVQLVSGGRIRTPLDAKPQAGNRIVHGVEVDRRDRHVAYWIDQGDGTSKRLPATGPRSGRRLAWLVYGSDKRHDEVRGQPLLSIVLQSLKEIDRYRDSAQRKAVINSILALFIEKAEDKMGTRPLTGSAVRRDQVDTTAPDGAARKFNLAGQIPGLVLEELQKGETPKAFGSNGTDVNFGPFESAIVYAVAWVNEIPPEVLTLAFSNNYSASQAAINEFKMYLNRVRTRWGEEFCQPVYVDWLLSECLLGKVRAPGLLEAWRDPWRYDTLGAWIASDWSGAIKPSTDVLKQAKGYKALNQEGWITNDRASRELTGTKFSKNIRRLRQENEMKVAAATPIAEFEQKYGKRPDEVIDGQALAEEVAGAVVDSLDAQR